MRTRVQFSDAASEAIAQVAQFHGLSDNAAIQLLCSTYAPLHLSVAKGVTVELDKYSRPTLVARNGQIGHTNPSPVAKGGQDGHGDDEPVAIPAQSGHGGGEKQEGAARGLKSLRSSLKS